MQNILTLKTADWDLFVWAKSPALKQTQLSKTLLNRGKPLPFSEVTFSCAVDFISASTLSPFWKRVGTQSCTRFLMPLPVFFENSHYEFEFVFKNHVDKNLEGKNSPRVAHKLNRINDVFRLSVRNEAILSGGVHFKNDIGWFKLPLSYSVDGLEKKVAISFEVLPTKMDLDSDLNAIYSVVDKQYPLWRFALAETTEQSFDRVQHPNKPFELLWIAEFAALRQELEKGFKQIINAPHSRLLPVKKHLKAERLKGKLAFKTLEKVKEDKACGHYSKRYEVTQQKLSVDTPENRFIKFVLVQISKRLNAFYKDTLTLNSQPETQRLSVDFFEEIKSWITPFKRFQYNRMFKEVGVFKGLNNESLVLQQKTGYSAVYKTWQKLNWYLDILGNQASVSMKTIEELYEVWCFLEVKRILIDDLKFEEQVSKKGLLHSNGLEFDVKNGSYGAFKFNRPDGITVELKHEPLFRNAPTDDGIRVWTTSQKPDILLEATFNSGEQFIWLFDAKYRIKMDKKVLADDQKFGIDWVPDDALNQMHRYRDALIYEKKANGVESKSRPVFGAYALYPGYFDQTCQSLNPYQQAINEIDIGAFPLLPSQHGHSGSVWLSQFLKKKLGALEPTAYSKAVSDYLYLQDAARIPYKGFNVSYKSDLTLIMPSAPKKGRDKIYIDGFLNGDARWYHVPQKTVSSTTYEDNMMFELGYLAIASIPHGGHARQLEFVWPIKSLMLIKRSEMNIEQAGVFKNSDELYWLLELEKPIKLNTPISNVPSRTFKDAIKLTTLKRLNEVTSFQNVEDAYSL